MMHANGRAEIPSFSLRQLAYLVAAAEHPTLAAAAEQLRISPSALSDAITDLERQIGERLAIRRRSQGVTLTPAGVAVVAHARRVLAESEELRQSVGVGARELAGPIMVGCHPQLVPIVMPPILADFSRAHTHVDVSFIEGDHDELVEPLRSGRLDVAFMYDYHMPGSLASEPLFGLVSHALLSAGHPLAGRERVALKELIAEDLILLDATPSTDHTLSVFRSQGLRPHVRHRTRSFEAVRSLVGRGLGYAVLVSRPASTVSYEGDPVVRVEIEPPVEPVGVSLAWMPDRALAGRAIALVDFAAGYDWPTVPEAEGVRTLHSSETPN